MTTIRNNHRWTATSELERVVEPLANYICANDKPRAALLSALAVLCREVDATNCVASNQFRSFQKGRLA